MTGEFISVLTASTASPAVISSTASHLMFGSERPKPKRRMSAVHTVSEEKMTMYKPDPAAWIPKSWKYLSPTSNSATGTTSFTRVHLMPFGNRRNSRTHGVVGRPQSSHGMVQSAWHTRKPAYWKKPPANASGSPPPQYTARPAAAVSTSTTGERPPTRQHRIEEEETRTELLVDEHHDRARHEEDDIRHPERRARHFAAASSPLARR